MSSGTPNNRAAQLRKIGWIVLIGGFALGGLIYLFGSVSTPPDENSFVAEDYKKHELEVQRIWGNAGSLVLGITRSFKRASTYSVIIIVISSLVAFVCFYLADHPHQNQQEETKGES